MRQDPQWKMISVIWKLIILLCIVIAFHLLITWGALGALEKTNSRLDALEQYCGYPLDKDTE